MGTDEQDATSAIADISAALDHLEQGLLTLIRAGAHAATPLEEVTDGLAALIPDTRRQYRRLQEVLERRDVEFETTPRDQSLRRRKRWFLPEAPGSPPSAFRLAFERTI